MLDEDIAQMEATQNAKIARRRQIRLKVLYITGWYLTLSASAVVAAPHFPVVVTTFVFWLAALPGWVVMIAWSAWVALLWWAAEEAREQKAKQEEERKRQEEWARGICR